MPMRLPSSMQGNVEDVRAKVMETTLTTCMLSGEYKTYDNRYYLNGYGDEVI